MKRHLILAAILIGLAFSAVAQDATLDTPITKPAMTKLRVAQILDMPNEEKYMILIRYVDANGNDVESVMVTIENNDGDQTRYQTAMRTMGKELPGEVAPLTKLKKNRRIIKACIDAGVLPGVSIP